MKVSGQFRIWLRMHCEKILFTIFKSNFHEIFLMNVFKTFLEASTAIPTTHSSKKIDFINM